MKATKGIETEGTGVHLKKKCFLEIYLARSMKRWIATAGDGCEINKGICFCEEEKKNGNMLKCNGNNLIERQGMKTEKLRDKRE